ncbi:APC family permease [Oleisolibacter albus]|uniref:APC family permease n=1 Tax=Oleisolibacter albus TaxID=2171757 RepID=UPI000DF1E542|nr:amino acid permease [Oleisolibacter albus]
MAVEDRAGSEPAASTAAHPAAGGSRVDRPAPGLSTWDGVVLLVGTVVGVGIFKAPALVAANAGSQSDFLLLWLAGGLVSLVGALVYAELASTLADVGGEYRFLTRAWGRPVGFLFAWTRLAVVQTGAIAAVAFVFGDYLHILLPGGPVGAALYAALAVLVLTAVNCAGAAAGTRAQGVLTGLLLLGILVLAAASLGTEAAATRLSAPPPSGSVTVAGAAMIFVLLTYGGWNEAAYLAGELRDVGRSMQRVLLLGLAAIVTLYVVMNAAYLHVLGLDGVARSDTVAATLAEATLGPRGGQAIALLVAAATLSTLNAALFTGARAAFALGRDYPRLSLLGRWDGRRGTPVGALLVQGGISLALVGLGALARDGFTAMVEFTAPAFWLFLLLTGLALFRFRQLRLPARFRVPLYPLTPALFCAACLFMLHASLVHTGWGALVGVAVLALGLPAYALVAHGRRPGRERERDGSPP